MALVAALAVSAVLVDSALPVPFIRVVEAEPATRIATMSAPSTSTRAAAAAPTASDPGQATPFPLSHIAAKWIGDAAAQVDVRWSTPAGGWQPWARFEIDHDLTDGAAGQVFTGLLRATDATRVEAHVAGGLVSDLQLVAIDTTHSQHEVIRPAAPRVAGAAGSDDHKVAQPPIVTRSQWGADESMRK